MQKRVLLSIPALLVSFAFSFGSSACANGDDGSETTGKTEVVATTESNTEMDGLVFDEETAMHTDAPVKEEVGDATVPKENSKELATMVKPKTQEEVAELLVNLKIKKVALLEEQNKYLKNIADHLSVISMKMVAESMERKAEEDEKKAAKKAKPMTEEAKQMYV